MALWRKTTTNINPESKAWLTGGIVESAVLYPFSRSINIHVKSMSIYSIMYLTVLSEEKKPRRKRLGKMLSLGLLSTGEWAPSRARGVRM